MTVNNVAVDLLGGCLGGMLQAVFGHPLDTIKVRLQAQGGSSTAAFNGPLDCLKSTIRNEGFLGLYKGLSSPFFMAGGLNAVIFSINGFNKRLVCSMTNCEDVAKLPLPSIVLSAWMTAPIYCAFLTPVDIVKNRLQVQTSSGSSGSSKIFYSGPIDCVIKTVKYDGIRGLFRGYQATCLTRFVGMPFYFSGFEATKRFLVNQNENKPITPVQSLVAGSVAGVLFWGANYPLDLVKTRVQTQQEGQLSIKTIVSNILKTEGVRGFYKGYLPCIIRAAPANAVCFMGVELVKNHFNENN